MLQNTQQPLLQSLKDRDTPPALFDASWTRAEKGDGNDTARPFPVWPRVRAGRGRALGYPNYAAWKLQNQMAKTPDAALSFMRNISRRRPPRAPSVKPKTFRR
ncbi:M3 family metallopeptidase [Serratia ureilytica]